MGDRGSTSLLLHTAPGLWRAGDRAEGAPGELGPCSPADARTTCPTSGTDFVCVVCVCLCWRCTFGLVLDFEAARFHAGVVPTNLQVGIPPTSSKIVAQVGAYNKYTCLLVCCDTRDILEVADGAAQAMCI